MSNVYELDPVVRLIEPKTIVLAGGQKIVMIDAAKRAVVPTEGWFRDIRYYLVGNSSDARHVGSGKLLACQLSDVEHKVDVSARFDVRCPKGNEERMALALFDPADLPGVVLQRYLDRWLRELSHKSVREFVDAYFANRAALESELIARASSEIGLQMDIRLSLDAERTLNRIDVEDDRLVFVKDFDEEEQYLDFKVGVEVDHDNRTVAVLQCNRYDDIHELVPTEIGRFIRENVTLHMFWTQLGKAAVRQPLIRHLNERLRPFGRKIGTLTLTADQTPPELEFLQESVDVLCQLRLHSRLVKINSTVQMSLVDLALYRAAKSPSLKKWLRDTLERVMQELLFEVRYVDVILRFATHEQRIKETLAERAAAIGYELKQFITIPDLEPRRWQKPFTVEVKGEFPTQRSDLRVKLNLVAVVYIPRLEEIEEKLNGDQPIPTLMESPMRETVEQYLHGTSPEQYYMQFDQVEKAIEEAIRNALKSEFHCEIVSIAVKPEETDLMARLRSLQQQIVDLTVDVPTLHSTVQILFRGKFQVEGVDSSSPDSEGWHRFQSRPAALTEVRKHIEEHLQAKLQTHALSDILFQTPEEQEKLAQKLCAAAQQYARFQFGLAISVDSLSREKTEIERNRIELERRLLQDKLEQIDARLDISRSDRARTVRVHQLRNDQREVQVGKLLQEQTERLAIEGTADEVAQLESQIGKTGDLMDGEKIPSMAEVEAMLRAQRAVDPSHQLPASAPPEKQATGGAE